MPYVLGIDVGTRYTAAALCRLSDGAWGMPEVIPLGGRFPLMPTVVYLGRDGSVLVGQAAEQRAPAEPDRVARDLNRRVGDDVPLLLGGQLCTAQELIAVLVRAVVDQVEAVEGPAERVVLTHRADWGSYRRGLLNAELARQSLAEVTLLPEAIAAAEGHAARELVYAGESVAVYSLGSGTFEAAVVRRGPAGGFELVGSSESVEDVGGSHFDDLLVDRVRGELGRAASELDPTDPAALGAMAMLRRHCTVAKQKLSAVIETTIPAQLPTVAADVRVTRAEFEELIRPAVNGTVETLQRTVRTAVAAQAPVGEVLLIGGSVRIPLVRELVTATETGRVSLHPEPDLGIARGAALAGRRLLSAKGHGPELLAPTEQTMVFVPDPRLAEIDSNAGEYDLDDESPPRPPIELTPLELPERSLLRRYLPGVKPIVLVVIVALVLAVGVTLTLMYYPRANSSQTPSSVLHTSHN
ncbi:MAG TPA: Hsp70 family protein [Pseudonocardiaceae bacterium]|jgi:molecular chaperone DnaK (HSP70)|nr:Hsp70 family protein [Pseudonocardiaceae bacterium]